MIHESQMHAMVLERAGQPLKLERLAIPKPAAGELLLKVQACGICRTDLHVVDGELTAPKLPLVPGHQIVGEVEVCGPEVTGFEPGDLVGVPWLGGPAESALTASRDGRISVGMRCSPATGRTAALPSTALPMPVSVSPFRRDTWPPRLRRSCAPV